MKIRTILTLLCLLLPGVVSAQNTSFWKLNSNILSPVINNWTMDISSTTGTSTIQGNLWVKKNLRVDGNIFAPVNLQLSGFTTGSTLFVGPSGTIAQDNANFFWDDTNNRLGIGTSTPQAALEVLGDLRLTGGGNTNIDFYDSVNTAGGPQTIAKISGQQMVNHGSGVLVFSTAFNGAPTEKMRIDRAGLIGIGTTTPSDKLGVNSSIGISAGSGGNTGYLRIVSASNVNYLQSGRDNTSNSAAPLVFGTNANATEWARFTSTGSFGIGTTTPASPLAVAGSGNIISVGDANGGTTAYMSFSSGGGFANIGRGMLGFNPTSNNMTIQGAAGKGLDFNVGNSTFGSGQAMVITAAGFVGIGTTSPNAKLNVYSGPAGIAPNSASDDFVIEGSGQTGMSILTPNDQYRNIFFGGPADAFAGRIYYGGSTVATAADQNAMLFYANGGEKLRISSSGNIGIGTTTPTEKLTIASTGGTGLRIQDSTAARIYLTSNESDGYLVQHVASNDRFRIYKQGAPQSEVLTILSSGNVGIGTTNPLVALHTNTTNAASQTIFTTESDIDAVGEYNEWSNMVVGGLTYSSIRHYIQSSARGGIGFNAFNGSSNAEVMRLTGDGNVGIGSTTPGTRLSVVGDPSNSGFASLITHNVNTAGYNGLQVSVYEGSANTTALEVIQQNSNLFKIRGDGNIGIGTSTPLRKLDIYSASSGNDYDFQLSNLFYNKGIKLGVDSANVPAIQGFIPTTGGATNLVLNAAGGNVGIGTTTPTLGKLHIENTSNTANVMVAGYNGSSGSSAQAQFRLFNDGGITTGDGAAMFLTSSSYTAPYANSLGIWNYENGPVVFAANGAEKMRIETSGNVGVGTTTPDNKLQVVGGIESTGAYVSPTGPKGVVLSSETSFDQLQSFKSRPLYINPLGNNVIFESGKLGNAGFGTTAPAVMLDVYGQIRAISPTLPTCNAAIYGAIQYDVSADNFYGCKTSGWVLLN